MHPNVHRSIIYNNQDTEPKCPSIDNGKRCDTYVQCKYTIITNSAIKKNKILSFMTTWKDIKGILLNKTEKYNYSMISLICGI